MNISLIAAYDQDPHRLRPSPACLQSAVCSPSLLNKSRRHRVNMADGRAGWWIGASTNLEAPAEPLSQPHTNIWNDMELYKELLQISQCSAAVSPDCRAGLSCCRLCSCTSSPRSAVQCCSGQLPPAQPLRILSRDSSSGTRNNWKYCLRDTGHR